MNIDETVDAALSGMLPYESWERLKDETSQAFAAFCAFRDFGVGRNIKRAMDASDIPARRYDVWRNWSMRHQWMTRAAEYDLHLDRLKRSERTKTIEAREEAHRAATSRMLAIVQKKLDLMDPTELAQGNVLDWLKGAINLEREALGVVADAAADGTGETKQLEIRFTHDFEGI